MSLLGAAIVGGIASLGSTMLSNHSARKEAQKNRDWQEEMSNTSISRRMADLRNAGLNPLLAVENASAGASTPSGSQAQIERFDPSFISALSTAKLQEKQGKVAEADARSAEANARLAEVNAKIQEKQGKVVEAQERKINAETSAIENNNSLFPYEARRRSAEISAIENSNSMFKYERIRRELENTLASHKIDTEKLQQDVLRVNKFKTQTEIIKNRLEAKGMKIDNDQAEVILKMLKNEGESWGNSKGAKNFDYILEKAGQIIDLYPIPFVEKTTKTYNGNTQTVERRGRR